MTIGRIPASDVQPFDLRPEASIDTRAAVLCLHGLTGTPYEVLPLAEALVQRGLRARGPWMAGHEAGHGALSRTRHQDWVELAASELAALRETHDRVFVAGISMGGLVTLRLAQTCPVDGIVVIGTPLALRRPLPFLARVLRRVVPFRKKRGSDIRDPAANARHPGLGAMPLASVNELVALQAAVIGGLSRIEAPILVAHGRYDRTALPRDAERIHAGVRSRERELFYLERSGHVATVDYDGPALALAVADFFARRC